jgi:hypothetical protein
MRFEARDLKSYAEPVSATDLRVGEVYFNVQFEDDKLHIPVVEPLIFLGRNLEEGDTDLLYFQDFESYAMGVRYASATEDDAAVFHGCGSDEINHIFEYERALDELLKCSLRRRAVA